MTKAHCLIFFLSASLWAQFTHPGVLRGSLQVDGVDAGHDYQVEVAECSLDSAGTRGRITSDYEFEFDDVAPGCKTVRVIDGPSRTIVHEVQVFVKGGGAPLLIQVPQVEKRPVNVGTVSADRLRHPLPGAVKHAMADANRYWQAGKIAEARKKLGPVVAKYPDYWEAHVSLGLIEMRLQDYAAAAADFTKAHELEPHSPVAALYAGFTLYESHRIDEAERAAKAALALEPGNKLARMLLGRIQELKSPATN